MKQLKKIMCLCMAVIMLSVLFTQAMTAKAFDWTPVHWTNGDTGSKEEDALETVSTLLENAVRSIREKRGKRIHKSEERTAPWEKYPSAKNDESDSASNGAADSIAEKGAPVSNGSMGFGGYWEKLLAFFGTGSNRPTTNGNLWPSWGNGNPVTGGNLRPSWGNCFPVTGGSLRPSWGNCFPVTGGNLRPSWGNCVPVTGGNLPSWGSHLTPSNDSLISDLPSECGSVILTKVDSANQSIKLSGAVLELYDDGNMRMGTYTTDQQGKVTVSDLAVGVYYWTEISPAKGYLPDDRWYQFEICSDTSAAVELTSIRRNVFDVFSDNCALNIAGKDGGTVQLDENITRAEAVTILFRLLNDETKARFYTCDNSFTDVRREMWFCSAVSTMAAMGVIDDDGGVFEPNAEITRAELAVMLSRFKTNDPVRKVTFADVSGHWAEKEINITGGKGWILGDADGYFKPDSLVSRGEFIAVLSRMLQRDLMSTTDHSEIIVE